MSEPDELFSSLPEFIHLMEEEARAKRELRNFLKEDPKVWRRAKEPFMRSETMRWKMREIVSTWLFKHHESLDLRNMNVFFSVMPPYFFIPPRIESYEPDIFDISWLNENGIPASPHDDWAYVNAFDLDDDVNPELFVLLRDPTGKIDPVKHAAGRHDLTQILTGHSVVGSGDYWLEMGATGRDGEWRVFKHKKDSNKEWKYELIEDDEGNKLIFHTYNERNLGEKKDLREEKACVDGD